MHRAPMQPRPDGVASVNDLGLGERIPVRREQIEAFCRTHAIRELALFGSVLRDDFGPESDVDFLVRFDESARHSLLGHIQMEQELAGMVGRDVDLVEKEAIENPFVRRQILDNHLVIYAA